MSYKNPVILAIPNPQGLDAVIESMRIALESIAWLDKSFGRAWEFSEVLTDGKVSRVPKVFLGTNGKEGEYMNVLPNDYLMSQSFIAVRGAEQWSSFHKFEGSIKERQLSAIFWVNLKEIDPTKNYIFIDELKGDVEKVIGKHPAVKKIDEYYDERASSIFDGYDVNAEYGRYSVDDVKTQYLMYPYAGMRFDFTVNYDEKCGPSDFYDYSSLFAPKDDIEFEIDVNLEGQTIFNDPRLIGYKVRIFRNTVRQSKLNTPGGYKYVQSSADVDAGQFHVTPAFELGEQILIEKY